ncbi:MAG: Nif3-like dinuclear metal center hexameric protein [Rikenellaceae bacterium]
MTVNNMTQDNTLLAQTVIEVLEEFAPLSFQEKWDNAGLLVGSPYDKVKKALLTLDVTEAVVDEAIGCGADMIISHHPLIFTPLKSLGGKSDTERAVIKAIKNDILIYASHTNMDVAVGGVSYKMGEKIELENMRPFTESGLGVIGELKNSQSVNHFVTMLKKAFAAPMVRYTKTEKQICRVALCGGSGAEFIECALAARVDAYISADFKYHDFFKAEGRFAMVDIGHFESEQYTLEIFYDILSKKLPNFAIQFTSVNSNPINYL